MVKRLGGVLLGFGVNIAGEFCISYNVRLGDMCARGLPTLTTQCLFVMLRHCLVGYDWRVVKVRTEGKGV
jgi:hypothetical protein